MQQQLTFNFHLNDNYRLANFYGQENAEIVVFLEKISRGEALESCVYLWGNHGVGRSHLLQACCQQASEAGLNSLFIPLAKRHLFQVELLEGIETLDIVCMDDVDFIANDPQWQEALFHLFNRMQISKHQLIVSAQAPPKQIPFTLPDLQSRLASGVIFQIKFLQDEEKSLVLKERAKEKGLVLSDEVASFLLQRCSRDMPVLIQILEKLDKASLVEQRRLTIPFVKNILKI